MIQHIKYQALKIKTNSYCVIALFVLENNVTLFKLLMKTRKGAREEFESVSDKNEMKVKVGDPIVDILSSSWTPYPKNWTKTIMVKNPLPKIRGKPNLDFKSTANQFSLEWCSTKHRSLIRKKISGNRVVINY